MATNLGSAILELQIDPGKLHAGMQAAEKDVSGSMGKMGQSSNTLSAQLKDAEKSSGGLSNQLKTLALAAVGAVGAFVSIKTVVSALSATQDLAQSIAKLGRETGLTAEESSKLIFAFHHYGLSSDDASRSLGILAKKLKGVQDEETGVTTGGKSTAEVLADIGVKSLTATGQLAPMGVIMPQIADVFKSMPDGVEKTGLAMQLFGRSGKDMIPVLNQGSEGLKALGIDAENLGVVMDQKAVVAAKNLTYAQRDLGEAFTGLQLVVGTAIIPSLTDLATWFTNVLVSVRPLVEEGLQKLGDFLTTHEEDIRNFGKGLVDLGEQGFQRLTELGPPLLDVMASLTQVFQDVAANLVPLLAGALSNVAGLLQDHPALVYTIIAAWASFQIGGFVQDLVGLASGLFGVATASGVATGGLLTLKAALITTGIGALIVGLATAAYLVYTNWSWIWPNLQNFVIDTYNVTVPYINALINGIEALSLGLLDLPEAQTKAGVGSEKMREEMAKAGHIIDNVAQSCRETTPALGALWWEMEGKYQPAAEGAGEATQKLVGPIQSLAPAADLAIPPVLDLGAGFHVAASGADDAAAATKAAAEALKVLRQEMEWAVETALDPLNAKIAEEEQVLADLDEATKQITESQQAWADGVDRLGGLLDDANESLRKFTDAQIQGTGAYDDALFNLGIQMDKLNLKINDLKQKRLGLDDESSKAKALDKSIEDLEEQVDALGLKADELRLEERIKFDPLQRKIDKLTDTTEEMSFEDIIAGITGTQSVIEDLTTALAGATSQVEAHDAILKVLSKSQEYHQEILDGVKEKYDELRAALEKIVPDLVDIADGMGEGYAEALNQAFKAMESGNLQTADDALAAAQTLFDDLEDLLQGSGQEQLLKPLGDVLTDAKALFAGTFQIEIPAAVTAGEAPLKKAGETVAVALTGGFIDAMGGAAVQLADAGLAAASGLVTGFRGGMPDILAVTQECLETFVDNMGGTEAIAKLGGVGEAWLQEMGACLDSVRTAAATGGTDAAIDYVENLITYFGDSAPAATDALKVLLEQLKQVDAAEDAGAATGQALTDGLGAAIETAAPALATSVGTIIDGVREELERRMGEIALWAGLVATEINAPLMQTLNQMATDLGAGNAMAIEEGCAALAGYINWLEMNGYQGTADALQKIMLLYKTAADDMVIAGEQGVTGLADALTGGLPGVTDAAGKVIGAAVGEVKAAGEAGMPPAANATMEALRQGMYAFQTEAGQWGATTMAWVCAGMYTYMAKDGKTYAQATGRTFIDGIIEGLNQEEGSLYDRIAEIIEAAIAAANAAAGAASPAKRFIEMGANFAASLQAGWGQPHLNFGVANLGALGGRQMTNTFASSISVYPQSGNPADIASEVERATRRAFGSMVQRMQAMEPTLGA